MTNSQPSNIENRMDRVEATLASAGELLLKATALSQRNAEDIQALTQRVNSLAAASEQHDRILDYLLKKEAGDQNDGE